MIRCTIPGAAVLPATELIEIVIGRGAAEEREPFASPGKTRELPPLLSACSKRLLLHRS